MRIGLQVPDFAWPGGADRLGADLAAIARTADEAGFEFLAVMDHFFQIGYIGPPEDPMLEAYTTLGYLAAHTSHIKLLTLVTGAVYRHPGVLAKQVTTLDVLSGGRAWLGIGAGWYQEEAAGLGIPFPPVAERFERLEETLQIVSRMFAGDAEPFVGQHYQLAQPLNSPAPLTRPRPPIMIGGGGEKKTLRLVAQYGDACNLFVGPDLPRKLDVLREHCAQLGRDYDSLYRTAYMKLDVGADGRGVAELLDALRGLADLGIQAVLGFVPDVHTLRPLEVIGREVIPVAAGF
ncbi:MAG: LLM class F420-dependent oxidoreductase [Micromonosporaceae bacterium]|nr:LLM class F420-dependent oxidoreductase [Micromonosporaceae bacterium]